MSEVARKRRLLRLLMFLGMTGAAVLAAAIPGAQAQVDQGFPAGARPTTAVYGNGNSASGALIALATASDLDAGVQDIAVLRPDGTGFRKLTHHHPGGHDPFWTSDGRWLVFWTHAKMWRIHPGGTGRERLPGDFELGDAVSADGRFVAVGAVIRDARGRRVRDLTRLLGPYREVDQSLWSPDRRYLALTVTRLDDERERTLILRVDGKRPPRLLSRRHRDVEPSSFSPDGRRLVTFVSRAAEADEAWVTSVDTGARRRLRGGIVKATAVDWSPDGRRFAYLGGHGGLYLTRATDGRGRLLARTASAKGTGVAWSPRGDRIALCDGTGLRLVRVADRRARTLTRRCQRTTPSWRPNGRELTFSSGDEVFIVSISTRQVRRVVSSALFADWPAWAPNRSYIAFARGTDGLRNAASLGVYVVRPRGAGLRQLGRGYAPEWAADSQHVVYVDPVGSPDPPGTRAAGRIIVAGLDGTSKQVATGTAPVWSPDGRTIAFVRYTFAGEDSDPFRKGDVVGSTLSLVGADGTRERVLARSAKWGDAQFTPRWAPDGSAIAVDERVYDETSGEVSHRITLIDPSTGAARPLADVGGLFRWSPDSVRLLLDDGDRVRVLDVATGSLRTVASEKKWSFSSAVWSPGGKRIAYIRYRDDPDSNPISDVWTARDDGTDRRRVTRTPAVEEALGWAP